MCSYISNTDFIEMDNDSYLVEDSTLDSFEAFQEIEKKENKSKEKTRRLSVDVSLDTEYTNDHYISIQLRFKFYFDKKLYDYNVVIIDLRYKFLYSDLKTHFKSLKKTFILMIFQVLRVVLQLNSFKKV